MYSSNNSPLVILRRRASTMTAAVAEIKAAKALRASPKASLIDALIKDEINQLTSLVAEEIRAKPLEASDGEIVDTEGWASDLADD
jgi:hypothetical protein